MGPSAPPPVPPSLIAATIAWQDGKDDGVAALVARLGRWTFRWRARHFEHWQRDRVPQLGAAQVPKKTPERHEM